MPPPSIAVLNEPVGNLSPMTLLWNLIGLSPVYEIICGSAELLGGILLLYRRTALAGALFSAFVMANFHGNLAQTGFELFGKLWQPGFSFARGYNIPSY